MAGKPQRCMLIGLLQCFRHLRLTRFLLYNSSNPAAILLLFYSSPLSTILLVLRTRNSSSLQLPLSVMNIVNGGQGWRQGSGMWSFGRTISSAWLCCFGRCPYQRELLRTFFPACRQPVAGVWHRNLRPIYCGRLAVNWRQRAPGCSQGAWQACQAMQPAAFLDQRHFHLAVSHLTPHAFLHNLMLPAGAKRRGRGAGRSVLRPHLHVSADETQVSRPWTRPCAAVPGTQRL